MAKKTKKNQRMWLILLIVVCMGIILLGGVRYVSRLRNNLTEQSIQNVMTVTEQQQQAFDSFLSGDRERLHSFAEYFSRRPSNNEEEIKEQLSLFNEVDAVYSVINLDTGRVCGSNSQNAFQMGDEELASYRALSGSGVRDHYTGLFSDDTMFGYYECFTFADGARGLFQKSYDRTKVSNEFSLSFYNDQGLGYVVNQTGDILLRSVDLVGNYLYENIFDVVTGANGEQENIDTFVEALKNQQAGSMVFAGENGEYVYTYVPVKNVEEWYLVSVVPMDAITEETDRILLDSQVALLFLTGVLVVCTIFVMLIWRTHKDMEEKDRAIEYQERLFDIFSTYLSNNTNDVFMMVDAKSDSADYVSPNVERVLGITSEKNVIDELRATRVAMYSGEEEADYPLLSEVTPGMTADILTTERVNPRTGEHKWFQESVYCTLVQGKRKVVLYISDRTQERKAQNTLTEALQMAQVANEAKSSFLSSVSHDIRTPMNAIIGFIALLKEEASNPEQVLEYTQRIDAASQHLLGLINDVLDMNKIESGSTTLNISELNLADVIDEINTIIRPQAKLKNQVFDITVSSLAYEHLQGDKLRINQILINLLSNAVKYTQEGGHLEFRIEELPQVVEDYSRVRFIVSDNGLGMSEEYQRVIFDPFTREETKATRQIQGTGLGMAITKSLVDLMGGTIKVESKLGEGSTFMVELELHIQEREDDPKFWTDYSVGRMIVADDDEEVCQNVVHAMRETGVLVDYSTNGETAIQMMREAREAGHPYDLILLDWKMPNLDGLETARLIRKNYPEKIPILLLTAYDWGEIEQEAMEIGVNHFMPKPFFMSTFKDAIRRVMGNMKKDEQSGESIVEGKHILVVDDIEVNRIILVKILSTQGAICDVAGNGQEAVEKFENDPPGTYDLILMDVQMPVMDGYEATRTIRASSHPEAKSMPIIAMTANAFVDDVRDAIKSGMDAHVAKPVQLEKLKETIQQVLDSKKKQKTSAV